MKERPYVLVNMAVTADGKIDTWERRGARISGAADSARVDRLRAASDAILVGGKTLLQEDPRLTVRDPALRQQRLDDDLPAQPTKVGIVSRIELPGGDASLPEPSRFLSDGGGQTVVCTTTRTQPATVAWLRAQGVYVEIDEGERIDLARAIARIAAAGVARLLVEGGSTIVAALLAAGLVDELQLAVAPLVVGGADAPTPVGGAGLTRDQAIGLTLVSATPNVDGDVVLRYLISPEPTA